MVKLEFERRESEHNCLYSIAEFDGETHQLSHGVSHALLTASGWLSGSRPAWSYQRPQNGTNCLPAWHACVAIARVGYGVPLPDFYLYGLRYRKSTLME